MFHRTYIALTSILVLSTCCLHASRFPFDEYIQEYRAPLHGSERKENDPYQPIPGAFIVHLFPGHSFDEHSQAVGTDMRRYLNRIFNFLEDEVMYSCKEVPDEVLEAIRRDHGVKLVEQNARAENIWDKLEEVSV